MDTAKEALLSLDRSAAHQAQAEAWEEGLTAFEELKKDRQDELSRVRGEAYEVGTMYAVFQTVILTAVSQASALSCTHLWSPVSLSIAVCVAAFLAIAHQLYSIGQVEEEIKEIDSCLRALVGYLDLVDLQGAGLDLETAQPTQDHRKDKWAGYRLLRSRYGISALVFLIGFSALITFFTTKTLCR